jgi:hypothetical protein
MRRNTNTHARLYLNDHDVGLVEVKGWDDAWGFGEFAAGEAFKRYARYFGDWSRLIHASHDDDRLTDADKAALRKVEYEIDRLHAKLFHVESQEWRRVSELNIDGPLVEWREGYAAEDESRVA